MEEQTPKSDKTHVATPTPKRRGDDLSIPLAIIFAGVLVAGAIIFSERATPVVKQPVVEAGVRDTVGADEANAPVELLALVADDHILGNPNAEVLIIEYSDPECPFCKRFHETMVQVMEQYGKSGQVAWVYRHFPLDQIHPKARKEGEAQECAAELGGNEAFWKYTDKLFEITPANNGLDLAQLPKLAQTIGLDGVAFTACLDSGRYAARVQRDFENGANVGVRGTPYTIVWNKTTGKQMPLNGAYPFENMKTILGLMIEAPKAK